MQGRPDAKRPLRFHHTDASRGFPGIDAEIERLRKRNVPAGRVVPI